jgi:hypothetical protein
LLTPTIVEEVLDLLSGRSSGRWSCLDVNSSTSVFGSLSNSIETQTCLSS